MDYTPHSASIRDVRFQGRHVISIADFRREEILAILERAGEMERGAHKGLLAGRLMATLFFEPSTRTRLSFEAAMQKLGGGVIGFTDAATSSAKKGESLSDTIRMVDQYADVIVMRHPREGAARVAAEVSKVPIINGGDGANQHPSQTFLDLYTISKNFPELLDQSQPLVVAFAGDLRYGRTVHSLLVALCHFNVELIAVGAPGLELPEDYIALASQAGITVRNATLAEAIDACDVLYMTRLQEERFPDPIEFDHIKASYRITAAMLDQAKPSMRILHPLPRVNEIAVDVDATQQAHYFEQAGNGIPIRQALLAMVLGAL